MAVERGITRREIARFAFPRFEMLFEIHLMEAIHARATHNGRTGLPNNGDDGGNVGIGGINTTHGIPPPHWWCGVQKEGTGQKVPLPDQDVDQGLDRLCP